MSTEQIISDPARETQSELAPVRKSNKSPKVDINILMDRVRAEKKKESKENLVFLSVIASVIIITGIIASF